MLWGEQDIFALILTLIWKHTNALGGQNVEFFNIEHGEI